MSDVKPEKRLERESLAIRVVWMILFALVWQVVVPLLVLVVLAQLAFRLFKDAPNAELSAFGDSLSQYLQGIGRFVAFSTDEKPWPVADWPDPIKPATDNKDDNKEAL